MTLTVKGRATRQRIIDGAARHLRGDDPAGVTLDDILAATHTSKGQLFHYFPDGKAELFLAVAQHEADRVLDDQEPHLSDLSSPQSWWTWRSAVLARYRELGRECPLGALMSQLQGTPGAAEVIRVLLSQWHSRILSGVQRLQAAGKARPGVDASAMASAFLAMIQGGVAILRATNDATHLERAFDVLLADLLP